MSKARDLANAGTALTTVSATELGYLDGVTSAVQTQVDAKIAKSTVTAKGDLLVATGSGTVVAQPVGTDGQYLQADSAQADGVKWAAISAGYATVQTFTSSTTWTVPAGITKVAVVVVGGGGGGGTSFLGINNSTLPGGCGGYGGQIASDLYYTVTPAASITVTIGGGGSGGASKSSTGSDGGNAGSDGSASVFGNIIAAGGTGGLSSSGTYSDFSLRVQSLNSSAVSIRLGGTSGTIASGTTAVSGGYGTSAIFTQSGSSGSNGTAASAGTYQGAAGTGSTAGFAGGGGSGGSGLNANSATAGAAGAHGGGSGGGGVRSASDITTTSGAGGAGAVNRGGGGGGGGGLSKNSAASATGTVGAGGAGGSGFVAIFY